MVAPRKPAKTVGTPKPPSAQPGKVVTYEDGSHGVPGSGKKRRLSKKR